jgi:hypothetical protein
MGALADPPHGALRQNIEQAIAELDEILREAPSGPAVRELRVRHGALARVVRSWGQPGPHAAQLGAMQECMIELRGAVLKACPVRPRGASSPTVPAPKTRPTARSPQVKQMKTTRPPPRRASASRSTRPPARSTGSGAPPSSRRG